MYRTTDQDPPTTSTHVPRRFGAALLLAALALPAAAQDFLGRTKSADGAVMVDLTPESYQSGRLLVAIAVNTHSVNDLQTYDLTKVVELRVGDRGYRPVAAPRLGGHHSRGALEFEVPDLAAPFSIVVAGLHDPGDRVMRWE